MYIVLRVRKAEPVSLYTNLPSYLLYEISFPPGEVSSISGSDSDTDSDGDLNLESNDNSKPSINSLSPEMPDENESCPTGRQHPKVFFVSGEGEVLSVYRSVLYSVKVPTYLTFKEWTMSSMRPCNSGCTWIFGRV